MSENKIAKLTSLEEVREYRKTVLQPLEPGEKKRALRAALRAKAREINFADREAKAEAKANN